MTQIALPQPLNNGTLNLTINGKKITDFRVYSITALKKKLEEWMELYELDAAEWDVFITPDEKGYCTVSVMPIAKDEEYEIVSLPARQIIRHKATYSNDKTA